jgi:hypothetical protein
MYLDIVYIYVHMKSYALTPSSSLLEVVLDNV